MAKIERVFLDAEDKNVGCVIGYLDNDGHVTKVPNATKGDEYFTKEETLRLFLLGLLVVKVPASSEPGQDTFKRPVACDADGLLTFYTAAETE